MMISLLYFLFSYTHQHLLHTTCHTELQLVTMFKNNSVGTTVPREVSRDRHFAGYAVYNLVTLELQHCHRLSVTNLGAH